MNVIAYTALLYGSDYLGWAIRSVIDSIDEYHVIYSPEGAHGHKTSLPCPDSRDELYAIAERAAGSKLRWHDAGPFQYEGQQRDSIHAFAPDADVILVLDADEVWGEGLAENAIRWCAEGGARCWRIPMIHYWRSFHRAIVRDPAYPVRVIVPKYAVHASGERTLTDSRAASHRSWQDHPANGYWLNHFGYAQRSELVFFKQFTHGHRGEWRRDCDWFQDRFMANARYDTHPVGSDYWNPEPVNPLDYLPSWMAEHPYFGLDVIP